MKITPCKVSEKDTMATAESFHPILSATKVLLFIFVLATVSCAPTLPPPEKPEPNSNPIVEASNIGESVEGRPIKAFVLLPSDQQTVPGKTGDEIDVILMIAAMHGDEVIGVPLLHQLMDYLKEHKELLHGRKVVLLPEVNPDGIVKKTRLNANNVDINRDFFAEFPQPETQAVLNIIATHRPDRVISIRELPYIDYDGPAPEGGAKRLAEHMQSYIDRVPIRQVPTFKGSLGRYGETHGIKVITFGIQASKWLEWPEAWSRYGNAIVSAITFPMSVPERTMIISADRQVKKVNNRETEEAKKKKMEVRNTPKEKRVDLDRAKEAFRQGEYDQALEAFRSAQHHGNCPECNTYIKKVKKAAAHRRGGIDSYNEKDLESAIGALTKVLSVSPGDDTAAQYLGKSHRSLGVLLFNQGEYPASRENFQLAERYLGTCKLCREYIERSAEAENALKQGMVLLDKKAYSDAVESLAVAARNNPEDPVAVKSLYEAHYRLAKDQLKSEDMIPARHHFYQALKYNSDCTECRQQLKNLHYRIGLNFYIEAGNKTGKSAIHALENAIIEWNSVAAMDPAYENVSEKIQRAKQYKERLEQLQVE